MFPTKREARGPFARFLVSLCAPQQAPMPFLLEKWTEAVEKSETQPFLRTKEMRQQDIPDRIFPVKSFSV